MLRLDADGDGLNDLVGRWVDHAHRVASGVGHIDAGRVRRHLGGKHVDAVVVVQVVGIVIRRDARQIGLRRGQAVS